jgi:hypothetical protein
MYYDPKIWGAVSVMMEGVYRVRPIFRLSNPILRFHLLRDTFSVDFRQFSPDVNRADR